MQPTLFDAPALVDTGIPEHEWRWLSAPERFRRFHAANPQVYQSLVNLARYLQGRGVRRTGIALLFERLRWSYLETHGDAYKLNNNYRAYYARAIMREHEDLAGFFETRVSDGDV